MQGALSGVRVPACSTSYSPCAPPPPRVARPGRACGLRIECVSSELEAGTAESTSGSRAAEPRPPSLAAPRGLRRTTSKAGVVMIEDISASVHAIILAGGPADNPLARYRAMPSVELGCNTQLIDVTISNCIRSGINKLNVLTQFNSHMLNTHLTNAYPPAVLGGPARTGFVDVLACHQTPQFSSWYRGSADAVRRNLPVVLEPYRGTAVPDDLLILSGQALYRMDYGQLIRTHREADADITICTNSVGWEMAPRRGLARVNPDTGVVESFVEKPTGDRLEMLAHASKHATPEFPFEASMGIYVFKRKALVALLAGQEDHYGNDSGPDTHFGHDVIPHALRDGMRVVAHHFGGYFRDVLTLRDLYEVNLGLARPDSPIAFYDVEKGIVSAAPVRPPSIVHNCDIEHSLVGEGSLLNGSTIRGCVIGNNIYVGDGCTLEDSLFLSSDFYTNDASRAASRAKGGGSVIRNAVIDNNVAIGSNARITNKDGVQEADRSDDGYVISEGIVVVLRNTIIPDGTVI